MPFHDQADVAKVVVAYETALRMLVMTMIMMIGIIIFYDLYLGNDNSSKTSVVYLTRKTNLLFAVMFCVTPV
jgi:hypothetical protein